MENNNFNEFNEQDLLAPWFKKIKSQENEHMSIDLSIPQIKKENLLFIAEIKSKKLKIFTLEFLKENKITIKDQEQEKIIDSWGKIFFFLEKLKEKLEEKNKIYIPQYEEFH